MIKFLCDMASCGEEIDQKEGGGTFTFISKVTAIDPNTKQMISQLKQEDFQLCIKHAQEVIGFIKKKVDK